MAKMTLINSDHNGVSTFKMIPITMDCPYNEAIFEPTSKMLAIISKDKKETFKMIAKLDDSGDPLKLKSNENRGPGKPPYKEQRVAFETYYEYHITSENDIREFVKKFADNTDTFSIDSFFTVAEPTA